MLLPKIKTTSIALMLTELWVYDAAISCQPSKLILTMLGKTNLSSNEIALLIMQNSKQANDSQKP